MPKNPRRLQKTHTDLLQATQTDVSLCDFADAAARKSCRLKKGALNTWVSAKKMQDEVTTSVAMLDWFDQDLSDFELDTSGQDQSTEDEEEQKEQAMTKVKGRSKKRKKPIDEDCVGRVWPVDMWCMLSEHIDPEEVSRFGAICHGTHLIIHTAKFWTRLYRRIYNKEISVPRSLRPENLTALKGLRARVIRTLFYTHQPFVDKQRHRAPFENHPYELEGKRCTLMWHSQQKNNWHFYFKFRNLELRQCVLSASSEKKRNNRNRWNIFTDIHHNPEDGCCVLEVITQSFISLPVIMGQVLTKAYLTVGHGMRYHKLRLVFNTLYVPPKKGSHVDGTILMMDPVLNLYVRRWWDPLYPGNQL